MLPNNQKLNPTKSLNKYVIGAVTLVCIIVATVYLAHLPDDSDTLVQRSSDELTTFAENFINVINFGDIDEVMSFYNDSVQFHGKNYSLQEIRLDKENYFKRWPFINFTINRDIEIINKGNLAEISIPVRFIVESTKRNEAVSGIAIEQLIVSQIEGKWKIIAESEQLIEKETYSTKESKTDNKAQNEAKKESTGTDNTQNKKRTDIVDNNAQFNSYHPFDSSHNVSYYVDYLNGLNSNDRVASCNQYSTSNKFNDFEQAAFKRACEIALSNQAKPVPTQNPANYPRQQEEEQQIDINGDEEDVVLEEKSENFAFLEGHTDEEICNLKAGSAHMVMFARQASGADKETFIKALSTKAGLAEEEIRFMLPIVDEAYEAPVYTSRDWKVTVIKIFEESIYERCKKERGR
ncbi:MAG: hypothetical protein IH964_10700 [Candidatus Dadabacteria bacterium]|nr:hypothetical protein [Candidatus Dadabacteria bacterium]